jgi:proteic killer suppression protein
MEQGKSSKIDAKMHKRIFASLDVAVRPEEMNVPGFDFHSLHGFDPKRYSVHVNGP